MARVLVGHDIAAYAVTGYGTDGLPNPGNVVGILGVYKDITVTLENDWADVTPSSQVLKEKRLINSDWNATLENQIRAGGATGFSFAVAGTQLIMFQFTEEAGGHTITGYGGIARDAYKRPRGEATDTLELTNTGYQMNNSGSLFYV